MSRRDVHGQPKPEGVPCPPDHRDDQASDSQPVARTGNQLFHNNLLQDEFWDSAHQGRINLAQCTPGEEVRQLMPRSLREAGGRDQRAATAADPLDS